MSERHSEAAFETVIEAQLLANGYVAVDQGSFDRERAGLSRARTCLHPHDLSQRSGPGWRRCTGRETGEQILSDLRSGWTPMARCATLRHGFKCYGRTSCTRPTSRRRTS